VIRITQITRGYLTHADRKRAIAQLKRAGFDHFVEYRDVNSKFALCYGKYVDPGMAPQLRLPGIR
jgi:hypothetical protein